MVPVPEVLLPPTKLREYLGPTLTLAALELEPGEISEPNSSPSGFSVLQMLDRTPESVPPFEEIRAQVRVEFRRRAGDRALREYLDRLRSSADLRVVESLR
jgi:parvulin-like peptidyl-prolyl isomerase